MTISVRLPSENSCEGGNQTKKVSSHQNRAEAASCFQLLTSAEKNFKNAWTNSLNLLLIGTLFFFSFFSKLSRQEIHTVVFFATLPRREIWIKLLSSFVFDNT